MENVILQLDGAVGELDQGAHDQVCELNELHLAMIGGGCAEVCPY